MNGVHNAYVTFSATHKEGPEGKEEEEGRALCGVTPKINQINASVAAAASQKGQNRHRSSAMCHEALNRMMKTILHRANWCSTILSMCVNLIAINT